MASRTAVGVNDDLASGETTVADGAANNELARGVDVVFRAAVQPLRGQYILDDLLQYGAVDFFLGDVFVVLGRQYNGVNRYGLAVVVIAQGHLTLGIRTQPGQGAALAQLCLLFDQAV